MSICRVFPCVVGRRCSLWPVCSLGKTLLAFALLHFVLQGQTCLLLQVSPDFLLLHSSPLWWKGHLLWVLVLGLIGLHGTIQLKLLQDYWSGNRLGLPWYWMVCLGNEQRSFCHFWDCIQLNSNTLVTSCEESTHWKRPWCWDWLGAWGEGDDRGWDGWMVSLIRWTWVWVNSGNWW